MSPTIQNWLDENDLPDGGYVRCHYGVPFGWSAEIPEPSTTVPGVTLHGIFTGTVRIARGGNPDIGAKWWDLQNAPEVTEAMRTVHRLELSWPDLRHLSAVSSSEG